MITHQRTSTKEMYKIGNGNEKQHSDSPAKRGDSGHR